MMAASPPGDIGTMNGVSTVQVFLAFCATFGLFVYGVLILSQATCMSARFHIDLKPWDDHVGIFQFVFVTFILVGLWNIGFSLFSESLAGNYGRFALAMGGGGLAGGLIASHLYRRRKIA